MTQIVAALSVAQSSSEGQRRVELHEGRKGGIQRQRALREDFIGQGMERVNGEARQRRGGVQWILERQGARVRRFDRT